MDKFNHIGNGIFVGEMRGGQLAGALADFLGENPNLRITAVTHTKSETLSNVWTVPFEFLLITEPKVQSSSGDQEIRSSDMSRAKEVLARTIEECEFSVRTENCLKVSRIRTVTQLVLISKEALLKKKSVGKKTLEEITQFLSMFGLRIGMTKNQLRAILLE